MFIYSPFFDYSSISFPSFVLLISFYNSTIWSSKNSYFCLSSLLSSFKAANSFCLLSSCLACTSRCSETDSISSWRALIFLLRFWCCASMNSVSLLDCLIRLSWMSWYLISISFSMKYFRSRFYFLWVTLSRSANSSSKLYLIYRSSCCSFAQYFNSSTKNLLLFSRKSFRLRYLYNSFLFFVISPFSSLLRL